MTALSIQPPYPIFTDKDGEPLENGYVWLGQANLNPQTNPISVYWDPGLTQLASQPIRTLNGYPSNAGTPARLYVNSDYSISVFSKNGVLVYSSPFATERYGNVVTAADIYFIQQGANAVSRTVQDELRDFLSVRQFGADPSNIASQNTLAFNAAIAECAISGKGLLIPGGTYELDADGVNFAQQGLTIQGVGSPILQYMGSGRGFVLNGGTAGSGIGAMSVSDLIIIGGPGITDGFYQSGVFRSTFKNIEVRECYNNAFTILHGVSNLYDSIKYSTNEAPQVTTPTNGLVLDKNGPGYYTADCTFTNCIMEGFSGRGVYIVDGQGNIFVGGTFEAVAKGIDISAPSLRNKFINVWFEGNSTLDAEVYGNANSFDGCYFGSNAPATNVELVTAGGTVFTGGFIRSVNMQAGSTDTTFVGCGLSDNIALNFQGTGSYKRFGCTKIDVNAAVSGTFKDTIGESGSWTPTFASAGGGTQGAVTLAFGRYVLIGSTCYLTGRMTIAKGTLGAGAVSVTNLPFGSKNITDYNQYITAGEWSNINLAAGYSHISLRIAPNSLVATLAQSGDAGGISTVLLADFPDPMVLSFSGTYEIE